MMAIVELPYVKPGPAPFGSYRRREKTSLFALFTVI